MFEFYKCFSCGKYQWYCDAKHFWLPIIQGLLWAVILAMPLAFLMYGLSHLWDYLGPVQ